MDMSDRFTVVSRKKVEVNTDPLRRCYNGCHFSSEMVWSPWVELGYPRTLADAEESVASWRAINPTHEYKFLHPGEKP